MNQFSADMEELLVALEAPPRTVDVQQFAKARAAELLSSRAALKRKRKAFSASRNEGDAVVNEDIADHSPNLLSLPRHLRRRTSSHTRRRRPLPWLYKKKKRQALNSSSSSSVSLPNNGCKRRRKRRPLQSHNHCAALPAQLSGDGHQGPVIALQVSVGVISSPGGESITAGTSKSHSRFQQEVSASLQQFGIKGDQPAFTVEDDPAQKDVALASQRGGGLSSMEIDDDKLNTEQKATLIKIKKKRVCRALRRLIEFKPGSPMIASDGTRRLCTHVWHAKRFTMVKKWGYSVPLGRSGRGHGSRAVLGWSKNNALLHDCSFINAIQLHGKEEEIMNVLKLVLELPEGTTCCVKTGQSVFSWRDFTRALLHHVGPAPHKIISPVVLTWKPVWQELSTHIHAMQKIDDSEEQDVWLWVHAAAFEEAFLALKDICSQLNEEAKERRLRCFSRRGELGRLDLVGQKSFAVLEKVLFPVCRSSESTTMTLHELAEVVDPMQARGNTVVQMEVCDPRLKQSERCLALSPTLIPSVRTFEDRSSMSQNLLEEGNKSVENGIQPTQDGSKTSKTELDHYVSKNFMDALWASDSKSLGQKFRPPLKEKFLSNMRHTVRLDSFGFTLQEFGEKMKRMLERRKSLAARFRCPVILLKHGHEKASACGWSVVLPLSWISAFWLPLVFAGGRVIGLRERHWLYTDAGAPSFPDDFPDSKAYTDTNAPMLSQDTEAVHERLTRKQRTVAKMQINGSSETYDRMLETPLQGPSGMSPSMLCSFGAHDHQCFVARTSEQLLNYLRRTHQSDLLLFPMQNQMKEKFKGLGRCLHEGTVVWRARSQMQETRNVNCHQDVCLLRVSIRPFHKGVVEAGAMVCLPTSDDYSQWSCMEKLPTVSASEACSFDGSEREIGYVTSMAPRGSKVPAGIAFCSAAALGLARGQQWVETTWQKNGEIFLLFCNKGSATFRPAFGSIFLETGPDI